MKFLKLNLRFWPTLFVLVLFALLMNLGFWQLQRYHEKQNLLRAFHDAIIAKPAPLKNILKLPNPEFHRVILNGAYLNTKTILLANRLAEHQGGYDVITPLIISNEKKAVLIDRGFIPLSEVTHSNMLAAAENQTTLTGYLKFPDKHVFILGPEILNSGNFPLQVQKINIRKIENETQLNLYPFLIRLSPTEENGFYREWPITTIMPERHFAYAIQWFAMALVLLIAYGIFCGKNK